MSHKREEKNISYPFSLLSKASANLVRKVAQCLVGTVGMAKHIVRQSRNIAVFGKVGMGWEHFRVSEERNMAGRYWSCSIYIHVFALPKVKVRHFVTLEAQIMARIMSGTEQEYGPYSIDESRRRLLFEERRAANGKKCAGVKWKPSKFRFWESRGEALPYM